MNNEPISEDEPSPIVTGLYRIPDDVKNEILNALKMWQLYSLQQNNILVERSFNALKRPYSTTTNPTPIIANGNSAPHHNSPDKLKNGINDFKAFLDVTISQAKGEWKDYLENIRNAFNSSIGGNI